MLFDCKSFDGCDYIAFTKLGDNEIIQNYNIENNILYAITNLRSIKYVPLNFVNDDMQLLLVKHNDDVNIYINIHYGDKRSVKMNYTFKNGQFYDMTTNQIVNIGSKRSISNRIMRKLL